MSEREGVVSVLLQSAIAEWIITLSLIFGGCCSNAWALELATSHNPHAGSLITFAQFILVSIYGFRKHITVAPVPIGRKDLLRRVAAKMVEQYSSKALVVPRIYVAIEGPTSAAFADELAREIELSSHPLPLKRFRFLGKENDAQPQLDSLWSLDLPKPSLVLVNGDHLHAGDCHARWNYSVLLVSRQDISSQGSPLIDSSLTVDISSQTHPIIISPASTRFNPLKLLSMLTRIRLKKRSIPISRWAIQVALFLITSLLNNAAFGYDVPMAVHIIFRSGGLVVNMLVGWFLEGRRYNMTQILSVILVTLGVVCTTLSASQPAPSRASTTSLASSGQYPAGSQYSVGSRHSAGGHYSIGILILTLALFMSGFMGLAQDRAYAKYGRGHWQEAMFYLHFLALPGFTFLWRDIADQIRTVNESTRVEIGLETFVMPLQLLVNKANMNVSFPAGQEFGHTILQELLVRRIAVPSFYFPLALNVISQLICVSGVHRLTSRVNSLTVTLVLVVRKAVSLGISAALLKKNRESDVLLWTGAGLVLAGTIGYTIGASPKSDTREVEKIRKVKKT